jgi:hypothetical protein
MPDQELNPDLKNRLHVLNSVVTNDNDKKKLLLAFTSSKGNWPGMLKELREANVPEATIRKIDYARSVADITNDNEKLVSKFTALPNVEDLRTFAFEHDESSIENLIADDEIPATVPGVNISERRKNYALSIHTKLFSAESSAVLHRMLVDGKLPVTAAIRPALTTFFANQPGFNIRTTSVYNAIKNKDAFNGISDEERGPLMEQLKTLQRVQAISPNPSAVGHLLDSKISTAYQVTEIPEKDFVKTMSSRISIEDSKAIYTNATNIKVRNEQALVAMNEYLNEPHIAAINRSPAKPVKLANTQKKTDDLQVPINWKELFGHVDFCQCGECTSVYSPASYFVELLQYLRNNNLGTQAGNQAIKANPKDISGTALEKLFRRRPDLGCLQLTCENTNTVLPYVDLVNEVMESFVVHLGEYHNDAHIPKQASLEHWNVEDETSSELLAQPQHINYEAYCILKRSVYPFTLPYHQPVDAIRIFLKYLETSRYELMNTFRAAGLLKNKEELPDEASMPSSSPDTDAEKLKVLNDKALDRAVDAEYLGITQEEYIILTKQAFWERKYFEVKCKKNFTEEEYREKIGVKPVHQYYGYSSEVDMLNNDETKKLGLSFVKKQFLKRTGISYIDLVELLKTRFINPYFPQGKSLSIMESIQFSYRFLQSLVDSSSTDPKVRFGKLLSFLEKTQPYLPLVDAILHPNVCDAKNEDMCVQSKQLKQWVYCNFEKLGKLIVLESGEGPTLPIEGRLMSFDNPPKLIGNLHKDGTITDGDGKLMGNVTQLGSVMSTDGQLFVDKYGGGSSMAITSDDNKLIGFIDSKGLRGPREQRLGWLPAKDTCDIEKVRLKHLDGSDVTVTEYDKMQRFIRLQHKLGWTIDETDNAISGLGKYKVDANVEIPSDDCVDCFSEFETDCEECGDSDEFRCPPDKEALVYYEITPHFLRQLADVKKVQESTGLELIKQLSFWTTISTHGEKSLYSRLFLTHNLTSIDKVFKADDNGNYLTKKAKITEHVPVLMAAFNLKAEDIQNIMSFAQLADELTLQNCSILYRYGLLMRVLHLKGHELHEVILLFGIDSFKDAGSTKRFLRLWEKMEDANFDFRQLNYIMRDKDNDKKPLAPKKKTILQLAKVLYDGLNKIDKDHPDLEKTDEETIRAFQAATTEEEKELLLENKATEELVRNKISLLFDGTTVGAIIDLLNGKTQYNTNAPKNLVTNADDFAKLLPAATDQQKRESEVLLKKVKYDFVNGAISVIGIFTEKEKITLKSLFNAPDWPKAIDRVSKQPLYYFNDVLAGIFASGLEKAKEVLLQGDINLMDSEQDPQNPATATAPAKRKYFLEIFLPFLREQLTHRFLVDSLSSASSVDRKVTDVLVTEILEETTADGKKKIIDIFKAIKNIPGGTSGWKGYLIPTATDNYIFAVVSDTPPQPIRIDGDTTLLTQQDDPSNLWLSDSIKLETGKSYLFECSGLSAELKELSWKTATSPKAPIPASVLLPDYAAQSVQDSYIKLIKAGMIATGFNLNDEELRFVQNNGSHFEDLDFNSLSIQAWKSLDAYARLRNSLPVTDTSLIEFLKWTSANNDAGKLSEKITGLTQWKKEDIDKLISEDHFDFLKLTDFQNAGNLLKLQKALYVADKISMDINLLFDWARPSSRFWPSHEIAESIRKSIRARYKQDDWEQVVKPLNDQLRNNQKQALIDYLVVQQDLIDWGVVDADSLFEFFLIDCQMDACMETSRIKQGISSVQLFVQRCFLGLEDKYGVASDVLDRGRWDWMARNVIWQANRKVFLYPENWIEENLRDDKSPFYKELESELLQKDVNKQTVQDALKSYLYKVDEVANMRVVGLFVDQVKKRIHVFSRTRNAPYFFYYRNYNITSGTWCAWEKLQVDIPSYDVLDVSGKVTENGCYLVPAVLNNRLLIFFPQFLKKSKSDSSTTEMKMVPVDAADPSKGSKASFPPQAKDFWEIKIGWSEYRNAKWTQKQISKEAVYDDNFSDINKFSFVPFIESNEVVIGAYTGNTKLNSFSFSGSAIHQGGTVPATIGALPNNFHYSGSSIHSLQSNGTTVPMLNTEPFFITQTNTAAVDLVNYPQYDFYYPHTESLLGKVSEEKLDHLFESGLTLSAPDEAFGKSGETYNELKKPYSIYTWELFFHVPATLAGKLSQSKQYEEAMKWYHYIFNPTADGLGANRAWQFLPFKTTDADNFLDEFFNSLQPNQKNDAINEWRDNPFQPHVIARNRPIAYMKWVVMKYLDNLVAWADDLFRQDTIESINYATQLYILAYHILGPRPQMIPKRGKIRPQTYYSLLDKWDAFGNAMVELELAFPFSNQTPFPIGVSNGVVGMANIFGFASSLYFCIPNNTKLMGYWDTIADRLDKIRHCENIEGIFRKLTLWDPPIDPALLVQAAAQGLSLDSVLSDLNTPMPNYRFLYLIQKALELCNELKSMGNSLLSVLEKKDAESLSKLKASHETSIQQLLMEVKKLQLDDANKALEGLQQNRKAPAYRLQHYLKLIGEDLNKVPSEDADFAELVDSIEKPVDESGLKLVAYEKEEMDKASEGASSQKTIGVVETLGSILNIIPNFSGNIEPFGVGMSISFGGSNLGAAMQAVARGMQIETNYITYQSGNAQRKGGFLRQLQDRVLQANSAGYEIKQIDKQIFNQQVKIRIAQQEIDNQQKQIDNANEIEEFLKSKYTNEELYNWMEGSIKTVYHQVYSLAYDLAKKAEKVFRFERGLTSSNFIQFGYWDASREGLFAGERLYVGIKQLEGAYHEKRGYDFEVTKLVSLRQINPLALLELREKGSCEFELPEVLFDMDYPGHYMRRIKSVSLSIPCIAGPYTSINATLRLLENKFRLSSLSKDGKDYLEKTEETDERFTTMNIPITSIAAASGLNDSGVFDLNFKDERYLPFEGAGVISKWRLEFPADFRQFDYHTITDAVIQVRYTSADGGDKLKKSATESLKNYVKSVEELSQRQGLFALIDLRHDYATEWYKAFSNGHLLSLGNINDRLPVYTRGFDSKKIKIKDLYLAAPNSVKNSDITVMHKDVELDPLGGAIKLGDGLSVFHLGDQDETMDNWSVKFNDTLAEPERMLMLIRYTLG